MKKLIFVYGFTLLTFAASAQLKIELLKIAALENFIASNKEAVVVVNFWATFCKPCVAEIPSFIKIIDSYANKNVKLILVSLDMPSAYPKELISFVRKNDYTATVVWLNRK